MMQNNRLPNLVAVIFYSLLFFSTPLKGVSQGLVNVNNVTGTANVTVPIFNVSVGDLSSPIALSYNASGLKVEDYDYSYGMGWRLMAEGSIYREVRGFPDDVEYQSDASYSVIKGWIRSTNSAAQSIQSFSPANNPSSCVGEMADATAIANNFNYSYDTEPDYFTVSAPGLSCSFVFDATTNHVIKTIPYRDYQFTYGTDYFGRITSFTVTNENGVKYYFDRANMVEHSIDVFLPGTTVPIDPASLEAFRRDFMMYRNKSNVPGYPLGAPVKYNERWALTKMEDTRGNRITYNYGNYSIQNPVVYNRLSYNKVELFRPSDNTTPKQLYGVTTARVDLQLQSISVFSPGFEGGTGYTAAQFNWAASSGSIEEQKLVSIYLPREKNTFELLYTKKFMSPLSSWQGFGWYFLKGIKSYKTNTGCTTVNSQFDFTYNAVDETSNTCYCTPLNPATNQITDTLINAQDYWGYYNGVISNTNLKPQIYAYPDNPSVELFKLYPIPSITPVVIPSSSIRTVNSHAMDGSLKRIVYPTGAITDLEYENNEFFDKDVNGNVLGGGIRIRKITNNDGLNNVDVTEYNYNDQINTALTSGRAVSVPKFTIAFPNSGSYSNSTDRVINSTYRTTHNLNSESSEILYGTVTVKKTSSTGPGIGKSIYEYNTTGTFGSTTVVADWQESTNLVARTNLTSPTPCIAIAPNFLRNGNLQYPFTSNPNFDFERGLLNTVTQKNEAGQTVAVESYLYTRSHATPTKVYGLKIDEIGNTTVAYGRYGLNTITDNFLTTKTSQLYNSGSATPITAVENYVYTSPSSTLPFRVLKSVSKQNSGSSRTYYTKFTYSKEYTPLTSGDDMNSAINYFNANNKNVMVETVQSFADGATENITSASLNTYKPVPIGDPNYVTTTLSSLPYKSYQFVNQSGLLSTGFTPSYINNTTGAFVFDNNYNANTPVTIEQYNTRGVPQLVTDNSRIAKTTLTSPFVYGVTYAEFTNAKLENIGIANFDVAEVANNIVIGSGNAVQAGGRYSDNCLNFQPNTTLCRSLVKPANAKNLIISFWLKDALTTGSIYLCTSKSATCSGFACTTNPIITFSPGSQWKYYQVTVPWGSPSLSAMTYSITTSTAVKLDDLLIYPDNAGVSTYSYTNNNIGSNLLTAKTGINGIGNTYQYDNAGRLWLVRDQFDNIIEMKKYKLVNRPILQIPSININYNNQGYIFGGPPADFNASLPYNYDFGDCAAPPIVYKWNFGDGAEVSVSADNNGSSFITHSYAAPGSYQLTVTASSPGMTDVVAQTPPTTNTNPLPVRILINPAPCNNVGTPVICASGIIQRTSAGQCILANCLSMPSTCSATYFQISSVTGGSTNDIHSVEWETAPLGTNDWTVWQPFPPYDIHGGWQTSYPFHIVHTSSYQMRAKVKFCSYTNTPFYSNILTVKNGD